MLRSSQLASEKFLISYEEKWNGTPLAVGSPTIIYPDLKREQLSDYSICKEEITREWSV